jgi:hypothetical protein
VTGLMRATKLRPGLSSTRPGGGRLDADFEFDERSFNQLHSDIVAWMSAPSYSMRPELVDWLKSVQS